jgi:hypothetical protein
MNKLISGAVGVQIRLESGQSKYYLPDVPELRNKRVKHIELVDYTKCDQSPDGLSIYSSDRSQFLTIMEQNTQMELISNFPVALLNVKGNRQFINKIVDMQRSFITLTGNITYLDNKCLYLVFWYDEPRIWGDIRTVNTRTMILPFQVKLSEGKSLFSENVQFKNRRIQNILLTFPAKTPSGDTVIPIADIKDKYLTLTYGNFQFFSRIPLYMFYQLEDNFQLRLQNIIFDMTTSYIESYNEGNKGQIVFFHAIIDDNK